MNRKDRTNASAAAVDAINTYYGRPNIPIGTDKEGPTDLQRVSPFAPGLRDGFPNDIGPDDQAPDAFDVYQRTLAAQPDHSVTICSIGALSNLAELWRRAPGLVRAKVKRLVVMGGEFPASAKRQDQRTHAPRSRAVRRRSLARRDRLARLRDGQRPHHRCTTKQTPPNNPVRRAYELRRFQNRPSIEGGQPSYDQAAALFAVRGAEPEFWEVVTGGRVQIDAEGMSHMAAGAGG